MYSFDMTSEQRCWWTPCIATPKNICVRSTATQKKHAQIPEEAVQTGWEIGLLPGSIEDEFGGFGEYSAITSALYLEELGWGDVAISLHLLTPNLFATPIALFGSKQQKETYLPSFCDETAPKATAAMVEPVYQFDPADLETTAEKVATGFVLNGKKTYVPLAHDAELFLVYAERRMAQPRASSCLPIRRGWS